MAGGETKDQAANAGGDRFTWNIEVALSGGGFRASAFSLGALLYLVHSHLNTRVVSIASVSGGSITNGFVASRCDDYASKTTDIQTFKLLAGLIARRIAFAGMWRSPFVWLYLAVLTALLLTILMIIAGAILNLSALALPVGVSLLALAMVLAYFRGAPVAWWMGWTFFGFPWWRTSLKDLSVKADSSLKTVDHVFCATDLNNSLPIFFSTRGGGRVLTRAYGMAELPNLSVARAVRASAAFPPAFPPVHLPLPRKWDLPPLSRYPSITRPRSVWLTDGGPYNNLGTDWSGLRHHIYDLTDWGGDEVRYPRRSRFGDIQLVIDASQPAPPARLWRLHLPGFAIFAYLVRVMNVMYGSTVSARTEDAVDVAKVQMITHPHKWKLLRTVGSDPTTSNRPLTLVAPCASLPTELSYEWEIPRLGGGAFGDRATEYISEMEKVRAQRILGKLWPDGKRVPTTLRSLGAETTLRLIVHGYLMTREVLTVALEEPHQRPDVPNAAWFEELIQHRRVGQSGQ
jgi:predicted acylesterase/phospholipase RssA